MTSVAVIGGGITGLAAARRLLLAGARVTVLEVGNVAVVDALPASARAGLDREI